MCQYSGKKKHWQNNLSSRSIYMHFLGLSSASLKEESRFKVAEKLVHGGYLHQNTAPKVKNESSGLSTTSVPGSKVQTPHCSLRKCIQINIHTQQNTQFTISDFFITWCKLKWKLFVVHFMLPSKWDSDHCSDPCCHRVDFTNTTHSKSVQNLSVCVCSCMRVCVCERERDM